MEKLCIEDLFFDTKTPSALTITEILHFFVLRPLRFFFKKTFFDLDGIDLQRRIVES